MFGGNHVGDSKGLTIYLDAGDVIHAPYCPQTHLPYLDLCNTNENYSHSFWASSFDFTTNQASSYATSVLSNQNTNLTSAQKEVILWHIRLSHASVSWIQLLMCSRQWLQNHDPSLTSFHSGPFLPCSKQSPTCDTQALKCISCVCAKAHHRSTKSASCRDPDRVSQLTAQLNGQRNRILKTGHTLPGQCISADHYLSPIEGRLYTSYGRE
jgi:hypothetical protein